MLYLELARRQKGWSQGDLGDHPKVRIPRNFISMIERGIGLPVPEQAERIAKVLGIPTARLLKVVPDHVSPDLRTTVDKKAGVNG